MLDLLYHLEHRMGRIVNGEPLRGSEWPVPEAATTARLPLVDIFEEPDVIRLVAEIPGVKPEDVKISVEGNLLSIKGAKERVAEEKVAMSGPMAPSSVRSGCRPRSIPTRSRRPTASAC
jgi:HSP20 family molecular chaperone IbpA